MPRKASIGATRDSAVYRVRIPVELKSEWAAHCEKKGSSQHAMIRALMRYVIQDEMPNDVRSWISGQIEGEPDEGPKQRFEVRFTPTQRAPRDRDTLRGGGMLSSTLGNQLRSSQFD